MGILVGLVFHFDGDIGFFEERLRGVVDSVLVLPQIGQFKEVILKDLGPFLFHVDLFGAPVAELAEVDPQSRFGVFTEDEDALAVGTGETIGTFIVFGGALGHAFAGPALVG